MPTAMSRFTIHDDLSAPEGSLPVIKGALASAGQLPNLVGVLAGSPAALRGYARFAGELRHGILDVETKERISLAVAEHFRSTPGVKMHQRLARSRGIGIDEVKLARNFASADEKQDVLLRYVGHLLRKRSQPPAALQEEALELGWTEEELLESIAFASVEVFSALINIAGDVPVDGSTEESRQLKAA
jgi:alkylhydroperoxidase family enzyme